MEKKNFAYETYKNVEAPRNYRSKAERERYIKALEARTKKYELPFLREHLPSETDAVLEIGSGSGRILHALLKTGIANRAVGIEISPSRVRFGRAWAREAGIKHVWHIVGDILHEKPEGIFNTVLCMTSIFPFFDMLQKEGLRKVLKRIRTLLAPGGILILESVTFDREIALAKVAGGACNVWEEYPKGDPFRFNLVRYEWQEKSRILTAHSYNVMRDTGRVDGPSVKRWHIERPQKLQQLLRREGYRDIRLLGDFDSSAYKEGVSPRLIITARV